jgi:eukaryotic-like serine/threonine-protein kinase
MNKEVSVANSVASMVALAADEYLDQLTRGEVPDIAEYVQRYPKVASVLPQVLPVLQVIQTLNPDNRGSEGLPMETGMLGEFRLIREIGRGGMGVVYEAEQVSLGRMVALKVLPVTAGVDAKQLARFQIETQIAAALHHPHVVPIFAVGCERGLHYYAMQLIEGHCLASVLRDPGRRSEDGPTLKSSQVRKKNAPIPPYESARLTMQAAHALDHAHAMGVLHRDIKPANLLVDGHGHLWVTDFGLARALQGGDLTQSGDLLGTLRYMSPEQAEGGRIVDARTDIYSLGATLYELLTGQPAFDGSDRFEIIQQIAVTEPVAPRKVGPTIPRDLETICLKAMAKEPEQRYTTAQELADDLARFLADRPIVARRLRPLERVARWTRRHRRATAAIALAILCAAIASTAGMAQLWKEQRWTLAALEKSRASQRSERQALRLAFTASDQIAERALSKITANAQAQTPAELERDRVFCRMALKYYEEIAKRYAGDLEMRAIAAAAYHRAGFIRIVLKESQAEDALRSSLTLYEGLLAVEPDARDFRSEMAMTYADLALLMRAAGSVDKVIEAIQRVVALRQQLVEDFPSANEYPISLAYHQVELCELLEDACRSREAEQVYRQMRSTSPRALQNAPHDHRLRNNLAWLIARRPRSRDDSIEAARLAREATSLTPENDAYWNTLGVANCRIGDWQAAAAALEQSIRYRSGGDAYDWLFLAMAHARMGDSALARTWYDRSLAWIERSPRSNQELLRFRAEAAHILGLE